MSQPTSTTGAPAEGWATWLAQCQARHADEPRAVADALAQHAPALPDHADGAAVLRLAEHVLLAHLADGAALSALHQALPASLGRAADSALHALRQRTHWAMAAWQGLPLPALDDAPRFGALQNLALAWARSGQAGQAEAWLQAEAAAQPAPGTTAAGKAWAVCNNNIAQELRIGPCARPAGGSGHEPVPAGLATLMLASANRARQAWAQAGGWLEVERAEYELALCHAVLGRGEAAQQHARQCLADCQAHGADAMETFFAHEALVHAHRAVGDAGGADAALRAMAALLPQVADADTQAWCRGVLHGLQSPAASP